MQVAPKVRLVAVPDQHIMHVTSNNIYIIGEKETVVLDTGMGGEASDKMILEALEDLSSQPTYIILSHSHEDHTSGVKAIQAATGAKIASHRFTVAALEKAAAEKKEEPLKVDLLLEGGSVLDVDGVKLEVVFTPGHSKEDICLYIRESGTLFTGDLIVGTGTVVVDNMVDYMNSLRRLLELGAKTILPGHGPISEDAEAKIKEYIDHRVMREEQIMSHLATGDKTAWELVLEIYTDVDPRLHKMAERNVLGHISCLLHDGRVGKYQKGEETVYKLVR